jgi:hypothetical protein
MVGPDVMTSSGVGSGSPAKSKTIDEATCPTLIPNAWAASTTVFAVSQSVTISPVWFASIRAAPTRLSRMTPQQKHAHALVTGFSPLAQGRLSCRN